MDGFVAVGRTGELRDGAMIRAVVAGREVLVARAGGKYLCADNRRPHLGGDLSRGTLEGTVVTCPDHLSQFDLADGRVVRWTSLSGMVARMDRRAHPPKPLAVYEVRVEGGLVLAWLP